MRVLTEFTSDLTDNQLPNVGPVILQEMYRIFQSENVRSLMSYIILNINHIITMTISIYVFSNILLEPVVVLLKYLLQLQR